MELVDVVADPEVQQAMIKTATDVATGNWLGALWGAGALVAAVAGHQTVKAVKKKKSVA